MRHTPGPWKIERPYQEPHIYIAGPKTELIACIKDHYENTKANAHLIAAAPELLEGLEEIKTLASMDLHPQDLQLQLNRIYERALQLSIKAKNK